MKYRTRTATFSDLDFLDGLYTQNMKGYVERVCNWDPDMFRQHFKPQDVEIIEVEGRAVGFTRLMHRINELYLAEVQIARKFQNHGLGTAIIREAIAESERLDVILTLKVLKGNPAEFLYKRLGFRVYAETDIHRKLSRGPKRRPAVDCGCRPAS